MTRNSTRKRTKPDRYEGRLGQEAKLPPVTGMWKPLNSRNAQSESSSTHSSQTQLVESSSSESDDCWAQNKLLVRCGVCELVYDTSEGPDDVTDCGGCGIKICTNCAEVTCEQMKTINKLKNCYIFCIACNMQHNRKIIPANNKDSTKTILPEAATITPKGQLENMRLENIEDKINKLTQIVQTFSNKNKNSTTASRDQTWAEVIKRPNGQGPKELKNNTQLKHTPRYFKGKADVLSNFYPCSLYAQGLWFHSAEQMIQYRKARIANDNQAAQEIMEAPDAPSVYSIAKRMPHSHKWDNQKEQIIKEAVELKLQNCDVFRNELMATAGPLIEDTPNKYWGRGADHKGQNRMGIILQAMRDRTAIPPPRPSTDRRPMASQHTKQRCYQCGELNHSSERCWYNTRLRCDSCHTYGHKAKNCDHLNWGQA